MERHLIENSPGITQTWFTQSGRWKQVLSDTQKPQRATPGQWEYLFHLSLGYPSTVIDDPCGLEACGFVELDQQLSNHVSEVLDYLLTIEELLGDLLAGRLYPNSGTVPAGVSVHAAHDSSNGWLLSVPCGGVCDICSQEDDRLLEHRWPAQI